MKKRRCKNKGCNEIFEPQRPLQYLCSPKCAYEYQKLLREKKEAKELRDVKKSLLTHKDYIKMFQTVFNAYIRKRDEKLPCISCGTTKNVEYAAGHYIPTTYQYHRFNEDNVHKQCNQYCNMHKRGNLHEYRINLIKKIGLERVEYLENTKHMMLEITIPEIQEKIKEYKLKLKELCKQN